MHVQVMDRIEGMNGQQLPWEGTDLTPAHRRRLGVFKASIVQLLARDPAQRPPCSTSVTPATACLQAAPPCRCRQQSSTSRYP